MKKGLLFVHPHSLMVYQPLASYCLKTAPCTLTIKNKPPAQKHKRLFTLLLFLLLNCFSNVGIAQTVDQKKLLKIEAAYLYKFTKFIKWPDSRFVTTSDLNICLIGNDLQELSTLLSRGISGKQSNGRTLKIFHFPNGMLTTDKSSCHMIYLNQDARIPFDEAIDLASTLVISSPKNKNTENSLLFLKIENGKLVFSLDQAHLTHSLLEINAALLSLARKR